MPEAREETSMELKLPLRLPRWIRIPIDFSLSKAIDELQDYVNWQTQEWKEGGFIISSFFDWSEGERGSVHKMKVIMEGSWLQQGL